MELWLPSPTRTLVTIMTELSRLIHTCYVHNLLSDTEMYVNALLVRRLVQVRRSGGFGFEWPAALSWESAVVRFSKELFFSVNNVTLFRGFCLFKSVKSVCLL